MKKERACFMPSFSMDHMFAVKFYSCSHPMCAYNANVKQLFILTTDKNAQEHTRSIRQQSECFLSVFILYVCLLHVLNPCHEISTRSAQLIC